MSDAADAESEADAIDAPDEDSEQDIAQFVTEIHLKDADHIKQTDCSA